MDQLGEGGPNIEIAGGTDSQTEIDIVERNGQPFVESSHLLENAPPHDQARSRHCANVLNGGQPVHITRIVMLRKTMGMPCEPVEPEHYAPMLDTPIRIDELCADAAHRLLLGDGYHFLEPKFAQHLDVVIDETDHIAVA